MVVDDKNDLGNIGGRNVGHYNIGSYNSGAYNIGNGNTGVFNVGDRNTGSCNIGDNNDGKSNVGNCNSGICNVGFRNSGNWNMSSYSSGFFNTEKDGYITVFDKPCSKTTWDSSKKPRCLYFNLTEWIDAKDMSDIEKAEKPEFENTGGYLKIYSYKEAFTKSVVSASKEDRDLIRALPNFDNEKFLEISGVDLSKIQ